MAVRKKTNKRNFYSLCVIIFAAGLLAAGVSLAYFKSSDEVTNRHSSGDISIMLLETRWDISGISKAAVMQPGMEIEKNPEVLNKSDKPVYVRIGVEIKESDDTLCDLQRMNSILDHVYIDNETRLLNDLHESLNPDFEYKDGWFYYKKDDIFTPLEAGGSTPELFSCVKIPVLRDEYNGVFDTPFYISITAQAVSASTPSGDVITAFENTPA